MGLPARRAYNSERNRRYNSTRHCSGGVLAVGALLGSAPVLNFHGSGVQSRGLTAKRISFTSAIVSMTAEKIVTEALALSPQVRAFVAERLIESLDTISGEDLSPAWRDEVRKRCREIDEGVVELREVADVFSKAHAALA